MQKDFHYDVTYFASLIAGFKRPEATKIAWAAQFVDDAITVDEKMVKLPKGRKCKFTPILTAADLSTSNVLKPWRTEHAMKTVKDDKHRQIWTVFHFPPGNYCAYRKKNSGQPLEGHVIREFRGGGTQREKDELVKKHTPLICRPNSDLVRDMMTDTRRQYHHYINLKEDDIALSFLGIRMHVFADTWAHQDHIGAPDRSFNRVESFERQQSKGTWESEKYIFEKDFKSGGKGMSTQPIAPHKRSSTMWLGHGPMGNWPDLPWAVYRWRPRYFDGSIIRNNPEEFLQAFVNMVHALKYIQKDVSKVQRGSKTLTRLSRFEPILSNYEECLESQYIGACKGAIDSMIQNPSKKDQERSKLWIEAFRPTTLVNSQIIEESVIPNYDVNLAKTDLSSKKRGMKGRRYFDVDEFIHSTFFCYHFAAKLHYQFMRNALMDQGITFIFNEDARKSGMVNDYKIFTTGIKSDELTSSEYNNRKALKYIVAEGISKALKSTTNPDVQTGLQILAYDLDHAGSTVDVSERLAAEIALQENLNNKEAEEKPAFNLFKVKAVKKCLKELQVEIEKKVIWKPDSEEQECQDCGNKFTFRRRKHHCRNCGGIFCDSCSSKKVAIPERGYKNRVRVCEECYNDCTCYLD